MSQPGHAGLDHAGPSAGQASQENINQDHAHMARAIQLAARGNLSTSPNPNVGCLIVSPQGNIVGQGWHQKAGEPHAEINALQDAGDQARGATAYVTLEPCSHHGRTGPCADALIKAGLKKVLVAMLDPNPLVAGQGIKKLVAAGIEVKQGMAAEAAAALNRGFIQRMRHNKPFVTLKLACSLDGKTAMASGESQWITSAAAREEVHRMRAKSSAILTASGTVMADNPCMTARLATADVARQPIRVVLDRELKVSSDAAIFDQPGETWLVCAPQSRNAVLASRADKIIRCPLQAEQQAAGLDLAVLMQQLAELEINDLMVESGHQLAGQLMAQNLLDELVVMMSPDALGGDAMSLLKMPGLEQLADRVQFEFTDVRQIGRDLKLTLRPV